MAFDPIVADAIMAMVVTGAKAGGELTQAIDRNLTQGLGVVNTSLIQSTGSIKDDGSVLATLQAASRSPAQGQTPV